MTWPRSWPPPPRNTRPAGASAGPRWPGSDDGSARFANAAPAGWPVGRPARTLPHRRSPVRPLPCNQIAALPPDSVRNPPLPHNDVVPRISARSLIALPRPYAMSVSVHRPDRDRCSSRDSVWAPRVVAVIQIPPRPSGARRLGMARPGAVNRRHLVPFQWATTTRPAEVAAGELPSTQTLWHDTATTSSSCVPARTEPVGTWYQARPSQRSTRPPWGAAVMAQMSCRETALAREIGARGPATLIQP